MMKKVEKVFRALRMYVCRDIMYEILFNDKCKYVPTIKNKYARREKEKVCPERKVVPRKISCT
jgi:hypothetical protein